MPAGATVQLTSPGDELVFFLDDAPRAHSFWRSTWRRHANFALESVPQNFTSTPVLGGQCSCLVSRQGDLLAGLVLEITLTKLDNRLYDDAGASLYCRGGYHPAEALVRDATLTLGNQTLERVTADWLRVYDSLHRAPEAAEHYKRLTNFDAATLTSGVSTTETLYLPLNFGFCRHPGLALPLVAMWNTEVRLSLTLADAGDLGVSPDGFNVRLFADYVYVDAYEKNAMMDADHTYLFEQVQTQSFTLPPDIPSADSATSYSAKLQFLRPVKCLYWALKDSTPGADARSNHARYVGDYANTLLGYQPCQSAPSGLGLVSSVSERLAPVDTARITFNGVDRLTERKGTYFNKVQPYMFCRRCPLPGLYMYSFALSPEMLSPTGVANFSSMDDAQLHLTFKRSVTPSASGAEFAGAGAEALAAGIDTMHDLVVFAWGYNLLRVSGGEAAIVFGADS